MSRGGESIVSRIVLQFFRISNKMLDVPPPPSEQVIVMDEVEGQNLDKLLPGSLAICLHEDTLYLSMGSLYYCLPEPPLRWRRIQPVPFFPRTGQSMTSTPHGVAFFGGKEGTGYFYNDLWVYNKKDWSYVTCDVSSRSHHAAAWDPKGYLVICGGQSKGSHLNDVYCVNLAKHETTKVEIPGMPYIGAHTMTAIGNDTFLLFGGSREDRSHEGEKPRVVGNSDIYLLNLEKKEISKLSTNFANTGFSSHFAEFMWGRLFVFHGFRVQTSGKIVSWMFDFEHNVWVPLDFSVEVSPVYMFCSQELSQKKSLHVLDWHLNKIVEFPIFTEEPPENVNNHPQFLHFLEHHLRHAIRFFDNYKSPYAAELQDKIATVHDDQDRLEKLAVDSGVVKKEDASEAMERLREYSTVRDLHLHASKVKRIMDSLQQKRSLDKQTPQCWKSESSKTVHQIVVELHELKTQMKRELTPLDQEATKLADMIEAATFDSLNSRFNNTDPNYKSVAEFERIQEDSRQLAHEIKYERARLAEELEQVNVVHNEKKETILNIRDQLWGLTRRETDINRELVAIRDELYGQLAQLTQLRTEELVIADPKAREAAKNLMILPQKQQRLQEVWEKLRELKEDFAVSVTDLDMSTSTQREGSASKRLSRINRAVKNLTKWTQSAKKTSEEVKKRRRNRGKDGNKEFDLYSPFIDSVGLWQVFVDDMDQVLTSIETTLNE